MCIYDKSYPAARGAGYDRVCSFFLDSCWTGLFSGGGGFYFHDLHVLSGLGKSGGGGIELASGNFNCCGCGSCGLGTELSAGSLTGHGEGGEDRENYQAAYEGPGGFLEEAVGLAYAHHSACAAELRRKASAFRLLDEDDADKQDGYNYCQYDYRNVHGCIKLFVGCAGAAVLLLLMALVYNQFLQEAQLVCKVSTFFWKFQI